MKRGISLVAIGLLLIATATDTPWAAPDDITHIKSHDKALVVTDPSKGFKLYPSWTAFPPKTTEYRKVVLYITYACPDGLHCGEWDYIDAIHLRRTDGERGQDLNIELARMISPYGWRFDSTWKFTWHVDITDFAFLLHDSVEIEFKHTGYESNTDRGWLITLDFEMTEGRPVMTCLGMDTLWCGSFPYGDTANPIETRLSPIKFHNDSAKFVRLRIHQTGHGMDDSANCAEFCNKWREVKFDDSVVNRRQIWRECGDNPLYPQSGTWVFDRANWCPGSIVHPDTYDFAVEPNSDHTVDIDMEPYINPNKPSANWYIYAYMFYYSEPWAENDVSVEEIIAPSRADEYARLNPSCHEVQLLIKNNGSLAIKSLEIGLNASSESFRQILWHGNLAPRQTEVVTIQGPIGVVRESNAFIVKLYSPNSKPDEFGHDNWKSSEIVAVPVLPSNFVLAMRTNHDSTQTSWNLMRAGDKTGLAPALPVLGAYTTIKCPFSLGTEGCFVLTVDDTAGDGLNFWYNVEGGYGYVRLIDTAGRLIKNFNSDFGNSIRYAFTVTDQPVNWPKQPPVCEVFPPRNQGKFEVDLFFDQPSTFDLNIVNDSSKSVVFTQQFTNLKDTIMPFDISANPDGVYWLKLAIDNDTLIRRVRVKRGN
jgi:hypothetical protein